MSCALPLRELFQELRESGREAAFSGQVVVASCPGRIQEAPTPSAGDPDVSKIKSCPQEVGGSAREIVFYFAGKE